MGQLDYRFLRGKGGASGYVREMGSGCALSAAGLAGGQSYALYGLPLGEKLGEREADGEGSLVFSGAFPPGLFLARGDKVVLWEGEDPEYLMACACLRRVLRRETGEREEKAADVLKASEAPPEPPPMPEPPDPAQAFSLRPPSDGEPIDALPGLFWPRGTETIQRYFDVCPPIWPFDAPGWRFVRAPSPIRQAAYCAVGRCVREDRVCGVAWAVPGNPYRPPAPLAGYRFHLGKGGTGYWVLWKELQAPGEKAPGIV